MSARLFLYIVFSLFFLFSPILAESTLSPEISEKSSVVFVAYPNVILDGKSLTVEWNAKNVSVCSASFASKGENLPPRGSRILSPQVGRQTYTITCTDDNGTQAASASKTVIVREHGDEGISLPTLFIGAAQKNVKKGEQITVSWEAKNAFACAGTGDVEDWLGLKHTAGSVILTPKTSAILPLYCWNSNGELGSPYYLELTVSGNAPLFIPEEEFSDVPFLKGTGAQESLHAKPVALCDRSATNFKKTKTVQCGRIIWKFTAPTIARLGKDPLPYLYKYHEYYEFLKDIMQFEPLSAPIRITEDKYISSIKINSVTGEIRVPASMTRVGFLKSAELSPLPLVLPLTRALTKIFLANVPQRSVFLWHPSLLESFADIIGVSAYLAISNGSTQVFWYEPWCVRRGKGKLCDSVLKTSDQYASISGDAALMRQKAIRVSFESLFPSDKNSSVSQSGAELFSAVTMLIERDLESVGRRLDYYKGLRETMRFITEWEGFPDAFKVFSNSSDSMKRKLNLFVFLLSIHTGTDFSWYYERFGFPISRETKDLIGRYLSSGGAFSISQAIETLAGIVPQTKESASLSAGTGLRGLYYDTEKLDGLKLTRTDPTIDFNWGNGSPSAVVQRDTFSVRWTGMIEPFFSGEYTFYTLSDDGVRLLVDNKKIIDNWRDHTITEDKGVVALVAGKKYPIQLEFYENTGGAIIKLLWSSKQQARDVVPASQLYPL